MIKVAEYFYSLQGEGASRGNPAVFIRMPHCNLMCKGKDWQCDSFALRDKFDEMEVTELWRSIIGLHPSMERFLRGKRVRFIYTGGEPGMEENAAMINKFREDLPFRVVEEIETNGSMNLNSEYSKLLLLIDRVNCSPKLQSSGNSFADRYNKNTLEFINELPRSIFKFVVADERDIVEIKDHFSFIDVDKIILMPATTGNGQATSGWEKHVWETAVKEGWKYSSREHITVWGMKAGV